MQISLTAEEARVLGCLMEKEVLTPDAYPLSLNALVNACNQTTSRDPVVDFDEAVVATALSALRDKKIIWEVDPAGGRVRKYQQQFSAWHSLDGGAHAVMTLLLLRGPQTPGEIKSRSERMHRFPDIAAVEAALARLAERNPPFVQRLPRLPGTKEARYAHLLCGSIEPSALTERAVAAAAPGAGTLAERVAALEATVERLRADLEEFRRQFE